jgi:hypothetical protein
LPLPPSTKTMKVMKTMKVIPAVLNKRCMGLIENKLYVNYKSANIQLNPSISEGHPRNRHFANIPRIHTRGVTKKKGVGRRAGQAEEGSSQQPSDQARQVVGKQQQKQEATAASSHLIRRGRL